MPTLVLETPEVTKSVSRPVVFEIVKQLSQQAGLPPGLKIFFAGDAQTMPTPGGALDDKNRDRFPGDDKIIIEVSEEYDANWYSSIKVIGEDNPRIFKDPALGVEMYPVYQRVKANVTVKYFAPDKTTALSWIRTMKRRATQQVTMFGHVVNYSYPISPIQMAVLFDIHTKRENIAGYNEDAGTWLKKNFTPKFTVIRDQAGRNPNFVIREEQVRIIGWYDFFADVPKPEKENELGNYSINFTYSFTYDQPESVVLRYPIMVHNQLLEDRWLLKEMVFDPDNIYTDGSFSTKILYDNFTYNNRNGKTWLAVPGIPVPYYDTWAPREQYKKYINLLRFGLQVNLDSPREIISLDHTGAWSLTPAALNYIAGYPVDLVLMNESVFQLRFYENEKELPQTDLIIAKDLGVMRVKDLDPRQRYHLCINLLTDPALLTVRALQRLSKYGTFAREYMIGIYPSLTPDMLPPVLSDGSINYQQMLQIMQLNKGKALLNNNDSLARMIRYGSAPNINYTNNQILWSLVGKFVVKTSKGVNNASD